MQDFEPAFYAIGTRSIVAEETYKQDIDCICASPWLAQIMTEKYQRWATHFFLSYDSKSYYSNSLKKPSSSIIEIAAYYRPFTDRRAVELVLMGLWKLTNQLNNFRVHFFGNHSPITFDAPFDYIDHGVLSSDELGELYRCCDVGVTFSATNYSLIPQEMMACDLPVVELNTECCRTVFPKNTICLTNPHPQCIADSIVQLLENKDKTRQQVETAKNWIKGFTWETAARTVESAILERLTYFDFKEQKKSLAKNDNPEVSVVIPTHNGGELFKTVLERVLAQQLPWRFEVVVVDSSSTDGTAEFLKSQSSVITHTIPKSEFQHGKTRNLGAKIAKGDYIAVITQDALPVDEYWLYHLIASLKKHPKAAGVFGKHLAWDNASAFTKRDLKAHFKTFDNHPLCVSKFLNVKKFQRKDEGWHQFLRFYSDNNSAMRKSVWKQIPYPEITFGEDQAWAKAIIDAGYEKIYSPHGSVYHSHEYNYKEQFTRAYEEYTFFKEEFGLALDNVNTEVLTNEIKALNERDTLYTNSHEVIISEEELKKQLLLNKGFVLGKYAAFIADAYGGLKDKRKLLEKMLVDVI